MSEKNNQILKTIEEAFPAFSEVEKEKLLSYGEGYAAGIRGRLANQSVDSVQNRKELETQGV